MYAVSDMILELSDRQRPAVHSEVPSRAASRIPMYNQTGSSSKLTTTQQRFKKKKQDTRSGGIREEEA